MKLENEAIKMAISNTLKRLEIAYMDDTMYKRLVNIGLQYAYIESELLEQMIKAELIILLGPSLFESS